MAKIVSTPRALTRSGWYGVTSPSMPPSTSWRSSWSASGNTSEETPLKGLGSAAVSRRIPDSGMKVSSATMMGSTEEAASASDFKEESDVRNLEGYDEQKKKLTEVLYSMKRSDEMPSTNESWSKPVAQTLELGEPRYFIGVKAPRIGSQDPISSRVSTSENTSLMRQGWVHPQALNS